MREPGQTYRHEVKIAPKYFEAVQNGTKNFELRKDDRGYLVGDILILKEYVNGSYSGKELALKIRYILRNCPEYGLMEGYCIIGF